MHQKQKKPKSYQNQFWFWCMPTSYQSDYLQAWGQSVDFDQLQLQFHIPNEDEIDFACEFINTFIYPELTLLNEKGLKISNNERLRSLTIIQSIAIGCFRMIPSIESEQIQDL